MANKQHSTPYSQRQNPFQVFKPSLQLLYNANRDVTVLDDIKYRSIDGDLIGFVGYSWVLEADPVFVSWHSTKGVKEDCSDEIASSLCKDGEGLNSSSITLTSSYFYGKLIARAARLALIAEELCYFDVIPKVRKFLKETIEPWLDGTFRGNAFLHDRKWGGIVIKQASTDASAEHGFGIYNDHHYHLGEAVNGYYAAALMGLAYGDAQLVSLGSTLTALEIQGTKMWWHVEEGGTLMYEEEFTQDNRIMGVLWSNKRDTGLWFAPAESKECRLGIQ
ncbi:hypothetical protein VNO78_33660 [Psophocarpus tetragonolobus]|uniref:glucan endo-1,3-beta-D-glucosidase n=1 Tax=Psophocarpus tetragonolobus TaxID=3891 RepID=A0AAN9NXE2_PSOTE